MNILQRMMRRFRRRNYSAAVLDRITQSWTTSTFAADSELRKDLARLRARSRDLCNNSDYAKKFLGMVRTNVLGDSGIGFRSRVMEPGRDADGLVPDLVANRKIDDAWRLWSKQSNCSVTRRQTWIDVQKMALTAAVRDGEVLVRKVRGFDNPFGFALQVIESDCLDIELNKVMTGGSEIRMGVEINQWREPTAYYLLSANPNDTQFISSTQRRYERVPAGDVLHLYIQERAEQTRGVPWMSTAMTRINMLNGYEEAELIAARIAASKMGFLKTIGDIEYAGENAATGGKYMDVEPGLIEKLPAGLELQTPNWDHPNAGYEQFMRIALRGVAAGLQVSYNSLGNDMASVNFASGKLGLFEEREFWKVVQRWFADHFCNPIYEDWLKMSLTSGAIQLPASRYDKFNAAQWRGRRWSYIDPQKEVGAQIDQINAGLTSISRVLSEQNIDRDELFTEIAEDKAAAERYGLEFARIEKPPPDEPQLDNESEDK